MEDLCFILKNMKFTPYLFLILFLLPLNVFAGDVTVNLSWPGTSTQSLPGGTTIQTVETQNITGSPTETTTEAIKAIEIEPAPAVEIEAPAKETAPQEGMAAEAPPVQKPSVSVGTSALLSTHIKVYKIPVSYSITENFKAGLTVPYVQKSLIGRFNKEELSNSGLGDVSLDLGYITKRERFMLIHSLYIKFPTGNNKQFEGGKERLPLGSGSYDLILSETAILKSDRWESIRWLGGLSYRYNGQSDYSQRASISGVTDSFDFKNKTGDSLSGFGGLIYFTPIKNLLTYCNISGLYALPGREEYYNNARTVKVNREMDDSLLTFELLPGIKYKFSKNSAVRHWYGCAGLHQVRP
ncbi:MAG: hypothetical protein HZA00_13540 [Nitrospinae bacterium]|nr:hypothetical protein [Nitrospinota bacterium]